MNGSPPHTGGMLPLDPLGVLRYPNIANGKHRQYMHSNFTDFSFSSTFQQNLQGSLKHCITERQPSFLQQAFRNLAIGSEMPVCKGDRSDYLLLISLR